MRPFAPLVWAILAGVFPLSALVYTALVLLRQHPNHHRTSSGGGMSRSDAVLRSVLELWGSQFAQCKSKLKI